METVNILGNDAAQSVLPFQTIQASVYRVWLCIRKQQVFPIEVKELLRLQVEEVPAEDEFRRQSVLFTSVQTMR
jgi:hypothetical protein